MERLLPSTISETETGKQSQNNSCQVIFLKLNLKLESSHRTVVAKYQILFIKLQLKQEQS